MGFGKIVHLKTGSTSHEYPRFVRLSEARCNAKKTQSVFTIDADSSPTILAIKLAVVKEITQYFDHVCWCHHNDEDECDDFVQLSRREEEREMILREALNTYQNVLVIGSPELHAERKRMLMQVMRIPLSLPPLLLNNDGKEEFPGIHLQMDDHNSSGDNTMRLTSIARVGYKDSVLIQGEKADAENVDIITRYIKKKIIK